MKTVCIFLAAALIAGCNGKSEPASSTPQNTKSDPGAEKPGTEKPGDKDTQTAKDKPVATSGPQEILVKHRRDKSSIAVKMTLAEGWKESEDYGAGTYEPATQPDPAYYTTLALSAECNGKCEARAIAGNVEKARESHLKRAQQPNINTGKPELDAVRADVEIVQDAAMDGGWTTILRVNYAEDLLAKGPYKPHVSVRCYYYGGDRDYYVQAAGRIPLAAEGRYLPDVKAMCQSLEVVGRK